jgi:hypothetical protein
MLPVAHNINAWFNMTLLQDSGLQVELRPWQYQLPSLWND